jgi:hypothetical protein
MDGLWKPSCEHDGSDGLLTSTRRAWLFRLKLLRRETMEEASVNRVTWS